MKITIEEKTGIATFRINAEYARKLYECQKKLKINKTSAIKQGIDLLYSKLEKKGK